MYCPILFRNPHKNKNCFVAVLEETCHDQRESEGERERDGERVRDAKMILP